LMYSMLFSFGITWFSSNFNLFIAMFVVYVIDCIVEIVYV
jgi:hypothetical protein